MEKDVRKFKIPTDGDIFIAFSTADGKNGESNFFEIVK